MKLIIDLPGQYYRFVELSLRFQDTILGSLFGVRSFEVRPNWSQLILNFKHVNVDHVCANA